jgi:hypothetical protein
VKEWRPLTRPARRPAAPAVNLPAIPAAPPPDPLADAKQAMRDLGARVIGGDPKAFDELLAAAK